MLGVFGSCGRCIGVVVLFGWGFLFLSCGAFVVFWGPGKRFLVVGLYLFMRVLCMRMDGGV